MWKRYKNIKTREYKYMRVFTCCLTFFLTINLLCLNNGIFYAAEKTKTYSIGEGITAVLEDGTLTVTGEGASYDFDAESAPFKDSANDIQKLVIKEGITYIGDYLFYGTSALSDSLMLPKSITGFGNYAFSGSDLENAPKFTDIHNKYEGDMEQSVAHMETLFYPGQSGTVICSKENAAFLSAANIAGYQIPDSNAEIPQYDVGKIPDTQSDEEKHEVQQQEATQEPAKEGSTSEYSKETESIHQVYVNSETGNDSRGTGSKDAPYKTIEKAAQAFNDTGTVNSNSIILLTNYTLDSDGKYQCPSVPFTLQGSTPSIMLSGSKTSVDDNEFTVQANIVFDNIKLKNIGHIYADGNDVTTTESVSGTGLYLYGAGKDKITKTGTLTINGGDFIRIIGYVRSITSVNASNSTSTINIGKNAKVTLLNAGSASGSVENGNVVMNINGGEITTIGGGCQGFQSTQSAYSGKTSIVVNDGNIEMIYGAGTGRDRSAPTFSGDLSIKVNGGNVNNIYGSGSAGYVISNNADISKVHIQALGGKIGNIYAAGKGVERQIENCTNNTSALFGSMQGDSVIDISGSALITGNVYASGQGGETTSYDSKANAYVDGNVEINVTGGTIQGNVFAGGEGIDKDDYSECARVTTDSVIHVNVSGGSIEGDVYGGGKTAKVEGKTKIDISGGVIKKNVYGGGKQGVVEKRTSVYIRKGTINGSVYGGAQGIKNKYSAHGGSTLNMTGGWVRGNLYGGSELSNDGTEDEGSTPDLVFVNLTGGTVDGKVFGGSYKGIVNGSTHLHIGLDAIAKCKYYAGDGKAEMPSDLTKSNLKIGGAIYAGGDYGGDGGGNYNTITVKGYSHVYIDGTGYSFQNGSNSMKISEGLFGSGASCDAGDKRLVTLDNFGVQITDIDGNITDATTLKSIQRADQVRIIKSHVRLSGQSDVANANQTTMYSLNRIGDKGYKEGLGELGNALILKGGSTVILDSASIDLANLKSVDDQETTVSLDKIAEIPNEIVLTTGTMLRIAYTNLDGNEAYGGVHGYSRISITDPTAKAYAYARDKCEYTDDGGFVSHNKLIEELPFQSVGNIYRYWEIAREQSGAITSERDTVLTAQTKQVDSEFVTEKAVVELPPILKESTFRIDSISLPLDVTFTDAAINEKNEWQSRDDGSIEDKGVSEEKMRTDPLHTFGLYMRMGEGFQTSEKGSVIPSNGPVGSHTTGKVQGEVNKLPEVEFYLTYYNLGITKSQDLGQVVIEATRMEGDVEKEKITLRISILTKATSLSDQTLDLYATQSGSYTGKLIVPSGTSRTLTLTNIEVTEGSSLKQIDQLAAPTDMAITMLPVNNQGWNSTDRLSNEYDLASNISDMKGVTLGTTDSRYEAPIEFTLYNQKNFTSKDTTDNIVLTFKDSSSDNVKITLQVHWKASIVKELKNCAGKNYEDFGNTNPITISSKSALTTIFQLGTFNDSMENIWLELRNKETDSSVMLPANTKLTLADSDGKFYCYTVTGTEKNHRIPITLFKEMWGTKPAEIKSEQKIIGILDFDASSGLDAGEYSFRLRSESTADSIGSNFTINPSSASVILEGQAVTAQQYKFMLSVSNDVDTHLLEQAAVVISPDDGSDFPEGTTFKYKKKTYPLVQGKAYLTMDEFKNQEIIMETKINEDDNEEVKKNIKVDVYPIGINAGTNIYNTTGTYVLDKMPSFAIDVTATNRKAKGGETLNFKAETEIKNFKGEAINVKVEVLKKKDNSYLPVNTRWSIAGNTGIQANGVQTISVIVPSETEAGTYRVLFTLGDKTVPYNIIISE